MSGKTNPPMESPPEGPTLRGALLSFNDSRLATSQRRNRLLAGAATVAAHIVVITALFWPHARLPHAAPSPAPIEVSLLVTPKPTPPVSPEPVKVDTGSPEVSKHPKPPTTPAPAQILAEEIVPDTSDLLSDSELAGASAVGEGGDPGGACNMGRMVQQALRRDPMVRTAVEDAHRLGKAIMLWNGDWVRTGGQDGKGLSAAREAITWEVAFAPKACRNMRVHGLVLMSLADGGTRFALGSDDWRWSDLLGVREVPVDH
jgi:hypothetical protein